MSLIDDLRKQRSELGQPSFKSSVSVDGELIQSVLIPVEIPKDEGKLRIYLQLSAEAISSPEILDTVLEQIGHKFDLAIYRSGGAKQNGFKSWRKF